MTNEGSNLRNLARSWSDNKSIKPGVYNCLMTIANRIDAEMVELPKDADGVPIHVGDTVWGCISGTQMAVHELRLTDRWTISTDTGFIPKASAVTHVRHDSFERIADELDEMVDAADSADDRCEKLADLADRIRKLAEREDRQCQ